jgi:hypothetical protein
LEFAFAQETHLNSEELEGVCWELMQGLFLKAFNQDFKKKIFVRSFQLIQKYLCEKQRGFL